MAVQESTRHSTEVASNIENERTVNELSSMHGQQDGTSSPVSVDIYLRRI